MPSKNAKSVKKGELQGREKVLSLGILFISIALIFTSLLLLTKSKSNPSAKKESSKVSQETLRVGKESTETYTDEEFGYSITYPSVLEPRTITSDNYLSFIIFFAPEGLLSANDMAGDGFAISVSEKTVSEEKNLIKKAIENETKIVKVEEIPIEKGSMVGVKIIFEPEDKNSFQSKAFAILSASRYTYSLSSTPNFLDEVLNNFTVLN